MSQRTLYASAARTSTPAAVTVPRGRYRGIKLVVDITAGAVLSITPKIEGVDSLSGKAFALLTGAVATGVSTVVMTVYPGATAAANVAANDMLPDQVRVTITHGNGTAATYTAAVHLIP
jgi:hypothetical protein